MNLTKREDGVVLLAGEPVHEWYKKRGITPVAMRYVENLNGECRMCLIAAMGFAALESKESRDLYATKLSGISTSAHNIVATVLDAKSFDIYQIELGFLSREKDEKENDLQRLGYAARCQILQHGELKQR